MLHETQRPYIADTETLYVRQRPYSRIDVHKSIKAQNISVYYIGRYVHSYRHVDNNILGMPIMLSYSCQVLEMYIATS